jgi:hypothetical protein
MRNDHVEAFNRGIVVGLEVAAEMVDSMIARNDLDAQATHHLTVLRISFSTAALLSDLDEGDHNAASPLPN